MAMAVPAARGPGFVAPQVGPRVLQAGRLAELRNVTCGFTGLVGPGDPVQLVLGEDGEPDGR